VQPAWMQRMSLPNTYFKHESQVGLRVAACAATFLLIRFSGRIFTHLGNQWHAIGVCAILFIRVQDISSLFLTRDVRSPESCRQVHMRWCVIRYTRQSLASSTGIGF
jgi:hypothetical protein